MRRIDGVPRLSISLALVLTFLSAGCGNKYYLNEYRFSQRTLAMVYIEPPAPRLLHGYYDLDNTVDALQSVARAAGGVAKEVSARRAVARLDSATDLVDVQDLLANATLERASRYLGTRAVQSEESADFILEVTMRSFGLDARSNTAAYMYTSAEAVLLDRRTGREIWSTRVRGSDRITPRVWGTRHIPSSVITAGTLSTVSVDDFADGLDQLSTFTARLITDELREKLRDARNR
ncbi:MAG TPA: hypothetical protein VKH19_14275 [Gemmatimonadaceae bacterium]|nr:hypothetical protein [Gemmatimonadaceae bacterium]